MVNKKYIIGRDPKCDHVIFDPKNRVSRVHAELSIVLGKFYIKDLNSLNGVCINGIKIRPNTLNLVTTEDKITLSYDYPVELKHFNNGEDDTKLLQSTEEQNFDQIQSLGVYKSGQKTVVFDRDKTQIGEMLQIDNSPFVTIGRGVENNITINDTNISRNHCIIRMLTPLIIEIEDLNSSNGTFADTEKIIPNKRHQYSSSVQIRLGKKHHLDLKEIFPLIQILPTKNKIISPPISPGASITPKELEVFFELEEVWKEYIERQNKANNANVGYSIGGSILALAFSGFTGGFGTALLAGGGGILGRYLGQQASNKIRNDLTYEDAFLQTYACPRCKESFQKKPWITVRECIKCKIKFR